MRVVDLGCGTGVFTTELLLRGASVIAVDYVETALVATRKRIAEMMPEKQGNVEYVLLDVMEKPLPKSDIVIAIGVAPYIDSMEIFLDHILPTTEKFYCLFLNKYHWINRLRELLRFLNVRQYRFFDDKIVKALLARHGFSLASRENIATGFLDEIQRVQ
jgi:predicted TPR repeat methyltransferase